MLDLFNFFGIANKTLNYFLPNFFIQIITNKEFIYKFIIFKKILENGFICLYTHKIFIAFCSWLLFPKKFSYII